MRFFLIIISVLLYGFSFGQELLCDSIYLKSGEVISVKVISKQRKTITYRVCLNSDTKTEKIKRKKINSIFYASNKDSKNVINRRDSIPYIDFGKIHSKKIRHNRIDEGKVIIIKTKDSLTYSGRLVILNKDTILLRTKQDPKISVLMNNQMHFIYAETPIALSNITLIKKPNKASKIIGNTIGGLFAYLGFALLIDLGLEEGAPFAVIADGISLPFFAMNYIRKRYNLETKWKAEVKFQKIE